MEKTIQVIKASRNQLLRLLAEHTAEELNKIPTGFNNNLAWQLGHIVVSQQLLCYKLSGNPLIIEENLVDLYKNGSKPERLFTAAEIEQMKGYLISTIDQLAIDLKTSKFDNYNTYTISTYANFTLNDVNDAVAFVASHDGLHYGSSLALKKLIKL